MCGASGSLEERVQVMRHHKFTAPIGSASILWHLISQSLGQLALPAVRTNLSVPIWQQAIFLEHLHNLSIGGRQELRQRPFPQSPFSSRATGSYILAVLFCARRSFPVLATKAKEAGLFDMMSATADALSYLMWKRLQLYNTHTERSGCMF